METQTNDLEQNDQIIKSLLTQHGKENNTIQDDEDTQLVQAVEKCFKEGNTLPIIKQELKCKIQYKRLLSGQGEITLDHKAYKNTHYKVQVLYVLTLTSL